VIRPLAAVALAAALLACGGDDDDTGAADASTEGQADAGAGADAGADADAGVDDVLADRPYQLLVPEDHDPSTPSALIVLLHGYASSGMAQLGDFGLAEVAEADDILVAYPDGTTDGLGSRFWNATDACCDLNGTGVDDVAYLIAIVDDVAARFAVDPGRVFAVGHSNGGFMSHRLACDHADRFAAIVSLAGATWNDAAECQPEQPVAMLQVHGDDDQTILYAGGDLFGQAYPSAEATAAAWIAANGCSGQLEATDERVDLVSILDGDETHVDRAAGCPDDGAVELWTMEGGSHAPPLTRPGFARAVVDFLADHAR
jgi:polyhydroxybutyrate depolymerase